MIGVAVIAILLTLAGNSMQSVNARSELKSSTGEVVQALRTAKHAARLANTTVTTRIKLAADNSAYIITFAFDDHQTGDQNVNLAKNGLRLEDVELPKGVLVSSDAMVFKFDPLGMVDTTGVITLISMANSDYESSVIIHNTMGYVTSTYSTPTEEAS